jgi:hypothetical protein
VLDLVQDSATAQLVCSRFDVGRLGPQTAVISHLASSRKPDQNSNSLNVQFLLFSAYLVFIMQSGFAMVSLGKTLCRFAAQQQICSSAAGPKIQGFVFDTGRVPLSTLACVLRCGQGASQPQPGWPLF